MTVIHRATRLLGGVGLLLLGWYGATTGLWGSVPDWSPTVGRLAILGSIVVFMIGIILIMNALGLVTTENLQRHAEHAGTRTPTAPQFALVYVGTLVVGLVPPALLFSAVTSQAVAWIVAYSGVLFLLAATGKPWWLYATVRRLGWFDAIASDVWMRRVMIALGAALIIAAVMFYRDGAAAT